LNQLTIDFDARAEGNRQADACTDKATRVSGFDREGAADFILGWLRRHGAMSGEALTDAAKLHGFRAHDDRAFGSVYSGLARRNLIRCVGFGTRTKGHGTGGLRIWAAVL
jgi:hypothetical protein